MRSVKLRALMLGSLLLGVLPLFAQEFNEPLTLGKAVQFAIKMHPAMRAARETRRAVNYRVDQVSSIYLPQLRFNLSFTRWDWVLPNKRIFLGSSLNDLYAEFTVQQLLYDGGKTSAQRSIALNAVESEERSIQRVRQSIINAVTKAYFQLLKAQRLVGVQQAAVANLQLHLHTAESLYRIGKVSQLDAVKAQVQLAIARDELARAENGVRVQTLALCAAMGVEPRDSLRVADEVEQIWAQEEKVALSADSLLLLVQHHPELVKAGLDIKAREEEKSLAKAGYYPIVHARAMYNREDSKFLPGHKNWNAGITLSLPIFQGGATRAQVNQAEARIEAARSHRQALVQKLESALRSAILSLDDARRRIGSSREIVRLSEESLRTAELKYSTGKGTSLDVLDAQTVLTNARINFIQALTDYLTAKADLYYIAGLDRLPFAE